MFEGISYHLQYLVRSALVVGVWQEWEMKGGTGRAVFVFFITVVFALVHSEEGLTKDTILVGLFLGHL